MTGSDALISRQGGLDYWNGINSTVNGMLGGFAHISPADIRGSLLFISKLQKEKPATFRRAVDIGAGIGRITAGVLSRVAETVDIVEPVQKFADEARQLGTAANPTSMGKGRIGNVYITSADDWLPEQKYDLIWFQWCLGHLTGEQMLTCLLRCKEALTDIGWIAVKENMSTHPAGEDIFDDVDYSITRTDENYRSLFVKAGLKIVKTELQKGFPADLFPVRMYALRPEQ